jgi:flagellar biosynthetic protein FlhB
VAEEDQDQKTEDPTGKRLGEARERGQLPISREISAWVLFVAIIVVVAWLGPPMSRDLITSLRVFIEMPEALSMEDRGLQTLIFHTLVNVGMATAGIFLVLAAAAIAGTVVQTGLFASFDLIKPDIMKLSLTQGFKKIFSTRALFELLKSFIKLVVLGTMVFFTLLPVAQLLPTFTGHPLMDVIAYLQKQVVHLLIMLLLAFTVLAVADVFYQRYTYMKNLRMTKSEVKDEYRQQEGYPMIKNRLRQIRVEKARKRMMAQVPKADVVVTNPTHYALALQYDSSKMAAPRVLAKGIDNVAERIRQVAEEHKIPTVSNPPLARVLYDTADFLRLQTQKPQILAFRRIIDRIAWLNRAE